MKIWVLAGLFSALVAPGAMAAENESACQLDEARRAATEQRQDAPPPPPAAPTIAQREAEPAAPARAARRRGGKPIPDAQLIGPRRTL